MGFDLVFLINHFFILKCWCVCVCIPVCVFRLRSPGAPAVPQAELTSGGGCRQPPQVKAACLAGGLTTEALLCGQNAACFFIWVQFISSD